MFFNDRKATAHRGKAAYAIIVILLSIGTAAIMQLGVFRSVMSIPGFRPHLIHCRYLRFVIFLH